MIRPIPADFQLLPDERNPVDILGAVEMGLNRIPSRSLNSCLSASIYFQFDLRQGSYFHVKGAG